MIYSDGDIFNFNIYSPAVSFKRQNSPNGAHPLQVAAHAACSYAGTDDALPSNRIDGQIQPATVVEPHPLMSSGEVERCEEERSGGERVEEEVVEGGRECRRDAEEGEEWMNLSSSHHPLLGDL